jgi:DNA helicase-2/ATP-dependent DNA helicase PcrA
LTGRHPESRILARPSLVKGLEFDRAVVLGAEKYNAHELYVAMTRGSVNLAVVSAKAELQPRRPG